jgi:hypothetical protein
MPVVAEIRKMPVLVPGLFIKIMYKYYKLLSREVG